METTKTWDFTCQSKSFVSIFFTSQVPACELQPFFCHDLANDMYSQNPKTVFSHLKTFFLAQNFHISLCSVNWNQTRFRSFWSWFLYIARYRGPYLQTQQTVLETQQNIPGSQQPLSQTHHGIIETQQRFMETEHSITEAQHNNIQVYKTQYLQNTTQFSQNRTQYVFRKYCVGLIVGPSPILMEYGQLLFLWLSRDWPSVRVYRLRGWGRGDYQKEGRGVSGV